MNYQYKLHRIITKISTFISGKTYIQTNMQIGGGCVRYYFKQNCLDRPTFQVSTNVTKVTKLTETCTM